MTWLLSSVSRIRIWSDAELPSKGSRRQISNRYRRWSDEVCKVL